MDDKYIPPEYLDNWIGVTAAAKLIDVLLPYVYQIRERYQISTQIVAGRRLYYLPDCERVRDILAKKRAERAKQAEVSQ